MSTCASLLHKLSSSEFWNLCTEYSTSCIKTQSYFKEQPVYRCVSYKNWRCFTIFSKSSTAIFITINLWCKIFEYVNVMISGNDCKYCNVIELQKTVFHRLDDYFPILLKHASCIQGCFKKAGIQFKCNALPNKDEEY